MSATLIACSGTYDDCILDAAGDGASTAAIASIKDSCQRKHEQKELGPIEIVQADAPTYKPKDSSQVHYMISNPTDNIVTQVAVYDSSDEIFTENVWIEPGGWKYLEANVDEFPTLSKALANGSARAKHLKVIPVK
jgi:hypothetical protein